MTYARWENSASAPPKKGEAEHLEASTRGASRDGDEPASSANCRVVAAHKKHCTFRKMHESKCTALCMRTLFPFLFFPPFFFWRQGSRWGCTYTQNLILQFAEVVDSLLAAVCFAYKVVLAGPLGVAHLERYQVLGQHCLRVAQPERVALHGRVGYVAPEVNKHEPAALAETPVNKLDLRPLPPPAARSTGDMCAI